MLLNIVKYTGDNASQLVSKYPDILLLADDKVILKSDIKNIVLKKGLYLLWDKNKNVYFCPKQRLSKLIEELLDGKEHCS